MDHLQGALRELTSPITCIIWWQARLTTAMRRRPNSAAEAEAAALEKKLSASPGARTPRRTSRRQPPSLVALRRRGHRGGCSHCPHLPRLVLLAEAGSGRADVVGKLLTQAQAELQAKDLNYVIVSQQYDELEP